MDKTIRFELNGKEVAVETSPERMLLWVLRTDLDHTGTKYGCGEGYCGACTVLVDGEPVVSCLVPFAQVKGRQVKTIEGVRSPLQEAFVCEGGAQCGMCTPGMIMAALAIPKGATGEEIRAALAGNLCRCTGYTAIYRSVKKR